jgi:hypothetical protein
MYNQFAESVTIKEVEHCMGLLDYTSPSLTRPWKHGPVGKTGTILNIPFHTYKPVVDIKKQRELEE